MGQRLVALFADAPLVFFGVVIGVAIVFRLGVGATRAAAEPEVVAPTFATGIDPRAGASADAALHADPSVGPAPTAEVGAAARVQPLGASPPPPAPARVAPRQRRGHTRRPAFGGGRRGTGHR